MAGTGTGGTNDGFRDISTFSQPSGIVFNSASRVFYVTDDAGQKIRKIDSSGQVSTLSGSGTDGFLNGPKDLAMFSNPNDIVMDPQGNLYVSDWNNHCLRKVLSSSGFVSTLAGDCTNPGFRNGISSNSLFRNPSGLFLDGNNLYVADFWNHVIRVINILSDSVTTFAGTGTSGSTDGPLSIATLSNPIDIAKDTKGNMFVTEGLTHRIRKISGGFVSLFAGSSQGYANGPPNIAKFNKPNGIVIDSLNNLYVSDENNHVIRKINESGYVSTFSGTSSNSVINGLAFKSEFMNPRYLDIDGNGNIYATDYKANNVRAIYNLETIDKSLFFANDSWLCTTGYCTETLLATKTVDNLQVMNIFLARN